MCTTGIETKAEDILIQEAMEIAKLAAIPAPSAPPAEALKKAMEL